MAIRSLADSTRRDVVAALATLDRFEAADSRKLTGRVLREMIGPSFSPHAALPTMQAVAASATAMQAVAASATAMQAVAASATAMQAVAASATARSAILNSPTAMSIVGASSMAIGKLVAGIAGLNPADYADMQAVAASATAMQAVAASATAMQAVAVSPAAMDAVAASDNALTAICKSQTAAAAVATPIQSRRSTVIETLNRSAKFTKGSITISGSSGTVDRSMNTNTIIIPVMCYLEKIDARFTVYYGADTSKAIVSVTQYVGTVAVTTGVSMRGIRVVISGGYGYMTFDVYTAA